MIIGINKGWINRRKMKIDLILDPAGEIRVLPKLKFLMDGAPPVVGEMTHHQKMEKGGVRM